MTINALIKACLAVAEVILILHPRAPSPPGHPLSPDGDSPRRVITLTLYSREGCHLCEVMLQALRGLQPRLGFDLQLVDVDRDPELAQRYDEWVPVLCCGELEICHYQLDEQALRAALRSQ